MTARLVVVLATLALIAGCGEEERGGRDDPRAALATAEKKAKDVESFEQTITIESDLGGQEFSFDGRGTSTADNQRGRVEGRMELAGQTIRIEGVNDGEFMYFKGDGLGAPPGKWVKTPDPPTSTMSPAEFVGFLKDSDGVEAVGTETVGGEETVHYRGPLNLKELAEESGPDIIRRLRENPRADEFKIVVDVWVGPDDLPARLALDMTAPQAAEGRVKVTCEIVAYDVPVDAEAPPESDVVEAGR